MKMYLTLLPMVYIFHKLFVLQVDDFNNSNRFLLLVYCLFHVPPIVCGGSVLFFVLVCITYVLSSFATILTRKRELVVLLLLSCYCKCPVALPHGAVDWSAVCDCGIS